MGYFKGMTEMTEEQLIQRAKQAFRNQKRRKGVSYKLKDFVNWYLQQACVLSLKSPSVGRIDHNKRYSFDNIILQELGDNVRERLYRRGNPGKTHKKVQVYFKNKLIKEFDSHIAAANFCGVTRETVWRHCSGRRKSTKGIHFKWK